MTPVYDNGNNYYKKMLELQRRLRRSEEERIRLEERFTLLEHESRSRHETCINRLRLRYIEFLEDQQARDERNYKLLGALDRVDSSLALISAKTDRLGNIKRQYEAASLFKNWYVNRRANGSVAGDSGVASQNIERNVGREKQQKRVLTNKHDDFISAVHPSSTNTALGNVGSSVTTRANYFPSEEPPDSCYNTRRPGIVRYNSSQMLPHLSTLSSAFDKGEASMITDAATRDRAQSFLDSRPETILQSHLFQQSPPKYRFDDYPRFNCGAYESTGTQSRLRSSNVSSLGHSRDPFESQRATPRAALLGKDVFKKVAPVQNYSGLLDDGLLSLTARSPPIFPKIVDILGQEVGDQEDVYRDGGTVENELERYMSRIPRLYEEADCPQSPEEHDQEQNTSGALLSVTLSDDSVDLSVEKRPRDVRTSPLGFGNVLGQLKQNPASRQTAIGRSKVSNVYQITSAGESGNAKEAREIRTGEGGGLVETRREQVQHGNRGFPIVSDAELRQLPSIAPDVYDNGVAASHSANNDKIAFLAKNGIGLDVASDGTESGTRPSKDNENIAKSCKKGDQEIDVNTIKTKQMRSIEERGDARLRATFVGGNMETDRLLAGNNRDKVDVELSSADPREFDGTKYRVVSGEESDTGNHLHEYVEDLNPWNLSALERRSQGSMILKEEATPQFDLIQSGFQQDPSGERWPDQEREINFSRTDHAGDQSRKHEQKIDEYTAAEDETRRPNDEISWNNGTGPPTREPIESMLEMKQQPEVSSQRLQESNHGTHPSFVIADELIDRSTREYMVDGLHESSGDRETDYFADNLVYPNVEHGATGTETTYPNQENASYSEEKVAQDPNLQYEYAVNEHYQEGSNDELYQPQQYDSQNNVPYDRDPSAGQQYQCGPDDQRQYEGHNVGKQNPQYSADPGQGYIVDAGQDYVIDTNQQYAVDSDEKDLGEAQQYPEGKDYLKDANQAYPAISAADGTYREAQEYADTDVYAQSGLPENEGFITEFDRSQVHDREHETSVEPDHNQSYGQEYEASVEPDHSQRYGQGHETSVEPDHNQSYGQEYEASVEPDHSQRYGQGHETSVEPEHGQGYETSVAPDHRQGYSQGHERSIELDHSHDYDQGHDTSAAYEPQANIGEAQSRRKLLGSDELAESISVGETNNLKTEQTPVKKTKDVINSLVNSDTESTIERNVSNAESDFDFN